MIAILEIDTCAITHPARHRQEIKRAPDDFPVVAARFPIALEHDLETPPEREQRRCNHLRARHREIDQIDA